MGCGSSTDTPVAPPPQRPPQNAQQNGVPQNRPQAQVRPQPQVTEIPVRPIPTTKDLLQQYISLDGRVKAMESQNVQKKYNDLAAVVADLNNSVNQLTTRQQAAAEKCKKEKGEFDQSVQELYMKQTSEENMRKEEREYLEARSEEEVVRKELGGMIVMRDKAQADLDQLSPQMKELQAGWRELEELLAAIFKGKYGSDLENKLEAEYDFLLDRQQRIAAARYKWTNGRYLLQHATAQLCVACKKWMDLRAINPHDQTTRFNVATEARNNIIAAIQNITSARRYLNTIDFPYCKPEEVAVLQKAVANVYIDMQSHDRHGYVYANVYLSMYKRCKALVDWFTHVLSETIERDFAQANNALKPKGQELRQERLNLISAKIKEELQQDVRFEAREEPEPVPVDDKPKAAEGFFPAEGSSPDAHHNEADAPPESEVEADAPFHPIPLSELVKPLDKKELFGDAQELIEKHQEDMEELEKNLMLNKARQEQGLEEKLAARRSKRQRMEAIEAQKAAVTPSP